MVFTSAIFLFAFLPAACLAYLASSRFPGIRMRNLVLLAISLLFYAFSGVGFCLLLTLSTVVNYLFGLAQERAGQQPQRKKAVMIASVIYNLLILGFFKYFNFFAENTEAVIRLFLGDFSLGAPFIPLPVGISFYTFQILSYQIDLYRGNAKVQRSLPDLALYIMLFPQLIAGPIVRYVDVEREIGERHTDPASLAHGIRRFMIGFSKKILLADRAGSVAESIFLLESMAMPWAWVGMLCYALQLYLDFSAYSDMAIGLGELFGFRFAENFRYPYCSKSIQEFWQRWHLSLSGWFRDYVYIPLGGSRRGTFATYRNLMIVFLLTGFWHGAGWTFLIWGLINGVFVCMERAGGRKLLERLPSWLRRLYVYVFLLISFAFFRFDTLGDSLGYLGNMFSFRMDGLRDISVLGLFNRELLFFLAAAIPACFPVCPYFCRKNSQLAEKIADYAVPVLFCLAACYMMASKFNPFIYFRF